VPNRVCIVKNLLEQSLEIVVGFEIFEIAQKTKKLALSSYLVAAPRGAYECPGIPSVGQLGHKNFWATPRHIITPK
jgi:hypothetical protein